MAVPSVTISLHRNPLEIFPNQIPLFSKEAQLALNLLGKGPKLLTDHSSIKELTQKIEKFNIEASRSFNMPLQVVCATLLVGAIAHFIFSETVLSVAFTTIAICTGAVPALMLREKKALDECRIKFTDEFLEAIDFFIENSSKDVNNSEFLKAKEYYEQFKADRFPKVSKITQRIFNEIDPLIPNINLDRQFRDLNSQKLNFEIYNKYSSTLLKTLAFAPATIIVTGMCMGIIGTGILPGVALGLSLLFIK